MDIDNQRALSVAVATDVDARIQKLIQLIAKDIRIEAAYLFGSFARGNPHAWSDIDVAIVSPDFSGDSFEDSKKLIPYILEIDTAIEVHPFTPGDFTPENPFVEEILKTGIRVY